MLLHCALLCCAVPLAVRGWLRLHANRDAEGNSGPHSTRSASHGCVRLSNARSSLVWSLLCCRSALLLRSSPLLCSALLRSSHTRPHFSPANTDDARIAPLSCGDARRSLT